LGHHVWLEDRQEIVQCPEQVRIPVRDADLHAHQFQPDVGDLVDRRDQRLHGELDIVQVLFGLLIAVDPQPVVKVLERLVRADRKVCLPIAPPLRRHTWVVRFPVAEITHGLTVASPDAKVQFTASPDTNDPKDHFNRLVTLDGPMHAPGGAEEHPSTGFTNGGPGHALIECLTPESPRGILPGATPGSNRRCRTLLRMRPKTCCAVRSTRSSSRPCPGVRATATRSLGGSSRPPARRSPSKTERSTWRCIASRTAGSSTANGDSQKTIAAPSTTA